MTSQAVIDELLVRDLDDWVYLAEVVEVIKSSQEEVFAEDRWVDSVIDAVRTMLDSGFAYLGDVTSDGFVPWNLPTDQALSRIRQEWEPYGRLLGIGEICWLCATPEGDRRAEEILAAREPNSEDMS